MINGFEIIFENIIFMSFNLITILIGMSLFLLYFINVSKK